MADGNEYNMFTSRIDGSPIEIVYPSEGTPFDRLAVGRLGERRRIRTPRGCCRTSCIRPKTQQLLIDAGGLRSLHPATKEPAGRKPLA